MYLLFFISFFFVKFVHSRKICIFVYKYLCTYAVFTCKVYENFGPNILYFRRHVKNYVPT